MKRTINDKFIDSFIWGMFILCLGFLLIYPAQSASAVKEGCELFYNSIFPTLFPFLVISSFAVNAGLSDTLGIPLKIFLRKTFGIKSGEYAYTVSVLSGYPASAKIISQGYNDGIISRRDAEVLLILCSNGSAAFILSYVGASLLGNMTGAYILLFANYISPIISAKKLSRRLPEMKSFSPKDGNSSKQSYISSFISAVMSSLMSVLNVGAFIVFFSVIRACAMHIAGDTRMSSLVFSIIELSAGCKTVAGEDLFFPVTVGLIGFLIGFGGICVMFQSLAFIESTDLDRSLFVKYKLVCGMINGIISFLLSLLLCTDINVSAIIDEGMRTAKTNEANILLLGILLFIIFLSVIRKDSENKT